MVAGGRAGRRRRARALRGRRDGPAPPRAERRCHRTAAAVTYLAEVDPDVDPAASPSSRGLPAGRRPTCGMPWARPGWTRRGPRLGGRRRSRGGGCAPAAPRQVRSWNLSSLWRLPLADGRRRGSRSSRRSSPTRAPILERLRPARPAAPRRATARGSCSPSSRARTVRRAARRAARDGRRSRGLQAAWVGASRRAARARAARLARRRPYRGHRRASSTAPAATRAPTAADALAALRRRACPRASPRSTRCGLPDTLVHGDFHPGNVRGDGERLVLLDWGDCGIGHPLLDQPAFLDGSAGASPPVRDALARPLARARPGPTRTGRRAAAPVAAARQALIYQMFLDGIEPSEQPYHRHDVPDWLRRTAALVRAETEPTASP